MSVNETLVDKRQFVYAILLDFPFSKPSQALSLTIILVRAGRALVVRSFSRSLT